MKLKSFLPSNNVIALLIVALAIIGSTFLIVSKKNENNVDNTARNKPQENPTTPIVATTTNPDLDSDGDGVKDWEETLYNTDPHKADSVASSTKHSDQQKDLVGGSSTQAVSTVTDAISRNLFAKYMSLQNSGEVDDADKQAIVDDIVSKYDPSIQEPVYGRSDIVIAPATLPKTIRQYGNTLSLIEKTRLGLMTISLQSKADPKTISNAYRQIASDMKQVPVPFDIAEMHLELINDYANMASSLDDIVNYQNDPVKGLYALKIFKTADEKKTQLYTSIASFFKKNGILFDKDEPGYIWNSF